MARIKKEDIFYTLLKEFADHIVEASNEYERIIHDYPETFARIPQMKVYESECDHKVKRIMKELYASFSTPIEREDISELTLKLDDIVDDMNGVVLRLDLFNIQDMRDEALQLAGLTTRCVEKVHQMVYALPNYKKDLTVMELAHDISTIEDEGDAVYATAVRRLFRDEENGRTSVTWLRVFDRMEGVLDACDRAAGVVRYVVMKSA